MEKLSSRGMERKRKNDCCSSCTKDFTDRLVRAARAFLAEIFVLSKCFLVAGSRHLHRSVNGSHCRRVYEQWFILVANEGLHR
jgi:hypothetical protein